MVKQVRYIFFIPFLLAGIVGWAQEEKVSVHDTLVTSQARAGSSDGDVFLPFKQVPIIEEKKLSEQKIDSLKKEDAYWYANLAPANKKEKNLPSGNSLFDTSWFNTMLWILILVSFTAVVIWYLASSNLHLFSKAPKKILDETDSEMREDIFAVDYDREIARAATGGNYRMAVRLWYLRTLMELSQAGMVNYSHEKTNSDYLVGLSGSHCYSHFFRLTRNFEYTWYGGFLLSEEGYAMMEKDFAAFKNSLS